MATLAEIRARLQDSQSRSSSSNTSQDNSVYPHWNIPEGKDAVVRFLPDGNKSNTFFWVERSMIRLPFAGIEGEPDNKAVIVQVPCVEMYNDGSTCPILTEVRGWFKDKSLEEMGRKYWKKRSYVFQGFVTEDPLKEENTPDNPIRRFIISSQIFQLIKSSLMDPELEELPTDYLRGIDFRISKTTKGGFADYTTSKWSRRERALSEAELSAIDTYGLFDLANFLPKKPTDVELKVIKEMFEASVDGQMYNPERWGQYFKPSGFTGSANSASEPQPVKVQSSVATSNDDELPFEPDTATVSEPAPAPTGGSSDSASRANEILAMIRNRQKS